MKLVKFSKDWADEFNVYGWKIFTDQEWEDFKKIIENTTSFCLWFGTNEGWEDLEDAKSLLKWDLKVKDISEEQAKTIQDAFDTNCFGIFPEKEHFEEN